MILNSTSTAAASAVVSSSSAEPSNIHSIRGSNVAMKRQRIPQQPYNSDYISGGGHNATAAAADGVMFDPRREQHEGGAEVSDSSDADIPLYRTHNSRREAAAAQRPRNVLEAQVQDGDTLQAIAVRYRCSVADIKRLNKIERDYEIHAHKTLQVPLTAENVLADHLLSADTSQTAVGAAAKTPADSLRDVLSAQAEHHRQQHASTSTTAMETTSTTTTSPFSAASGGSRGPSINEIILNTKIQPNQYVDTAEAINAQLTYDEENTLAEQSLLDGHQHDGDDAFVRQPRPIRAGGGIDLSCSGSDCDISWTVLLVCILALCFAIPLIYVLYIAEHNHVDDSSNGGVVVHHQPADDFHPSDPHQHSDA